MDRANGPDPTVIALAAGVPETIATARQLPRDFMVVVEVEWTAAVDADIKPRLFGGKVRGVLPYSSKQ